MKFDVNNAKAHPHRQVHLDFHTSPDIKGIGSKFNKEQFQAALKEGHVASVTVFAKCHHGVCYYPTKVGTMHPGLDFDLLGAQLEAAHEIGVRAPIYVTGGWCENDAVAHPEWRSRVNGEYRVRNQDENAADDDPRPHCSWKHLCLNDGAYCQHIYDLLEEICQRYDRVDGFFIDICFVDPYCTCDECTAGMLKMGLDPNNEADARAYYDLKHIAFMKKCKAILDKYNPEGTIFFNSGGAEIDRPQYHPYETHYEMEDLPTAWGGYDKLPLRASYFEQTKKGTIGMTGKFHLEWGEFGGFKSGDALRYEAALMAVYGVGCSIGDHLFPDGEADMQTYRNIGEAFSYYEKLEPYIFGDSTSKLGFFLSSDESANSGMTKALVESHIDFKIAFENTFSDFDAVVFPGKCVLSEEGKKNLKAYVENGGKVLFSHEALIEDGEFILDCGLKNPVSVSDDCDYILTLPTLGNDLLTSPFLVYEPGVRAENVDGEIYAELLPQQFNRTYAHFCGHKNTPYDKDAKRYPAVVKKGNVVYTAHPLAATYDKVGSIYHKRALVDAFMLLEPDWSLKTDTYSQARCRMIRQPEENRYCINMTYASPVKRGCAEIIEDICPIYDVAFTVKVKEKIKRVYLPLRDKELDFTENGETVSFVLPKLECHETVVLEY